MKIWSTLLLFGVPLFLTLSFSLLLPQLFLTGIGNVGQNRFDRIPFLLQSAYLYHPYWIPLVAVAILPTTLKAFQNNVSRAILIFLLLLFLFLSFKVSMTTLEVYRSVS
jgi:hypothetical protein